MESIISSLRENINWIKDIFTLIFVGAATTISILAYRRARATVLQPIRSEVIKKQSKILSEVLDFISKGELGIDGSLDYVGVAQVSTFLALKDYGFVFRNQEKMYEDIDKKVHGILFCPESEQLEDFEIIGAFDEQKAEDIEKEMKDKGKKRFERLKSGIVEVERIYVTKKHRECYCMLADYADNSFLPSRISQKLMKICADVQTNLEVHMKAVLEKFLSNFSEKYFKEKVYPKVSPIGVYNDFNHRRIYHTADVETLKSEVRNYLRIEDDW